MVQEEVTGGAPVVRRTVPVFPEAPRVPRTPLPHKRFQTGQEGVEIRPLRGPAIPIPANEDEDFLARFSAWHDATNGSLPEYIVFEYLVTKKAMVQNVDFVYQHPQLGGRTEFGGFVLDFFFPITRMGWRVLGERFHLLQTADRTRDFIAEQLLTQRGISPMIDLWEDDLLTRPVFVLEKALRGLQVGERRPV